MKKLLLILAFAGLSVSCGDDDSGASSGPKPLTMTVTTPDVNEQKTWAFSYDAKDRIQTMSREGQQVTFNYDEKGRIARLDLEANLFHELIYDQDGYMTAITGNAGTNLEIEHLGDDRYLANGNIFSFTPDGDWERYLQLEYEYSNAKAAFANVKGINFLVMALIDLDFVYHGSKKRRVNIREGDDNFPITYTDGEKGLPASESFGNLDITYQYEQE